jgi:hypothetical protein
MRSSKSFGGTPLYSGKSVALIDCPSAARCHDSTSLKRRSTMTNGNVPTRFTRIEFKKTPLVAVLQDELREFLRGGSGCEFAQQFNALLVQLVCKCDGEAAPVHRGEVAET